MNYKKHYDLLINRARNRILEGYTEKHHVVPRCVGGDDSPENIVSLTAEEHYVAHQLLVKIYPQEQKLVYAAMMMTVGNRNHIRINNKRYGWLKKKFSEIHSERQSKILKAKNLTPWNKGKTWEEIYGKVGAARLRKKRAATRGKSWEERFDSERARELRTNHPLKGTRKSDSHRENLSRACMGRGKGIPKTEEHRANMSRARAGIPKSKFICSRCNQLVGGKSNLIRWHEGNCRVSNHE